MQATNSNHQRANLHRATNHASRASFPRAVTAPISFVKRYFADDLLESDSIESRWSYTWLKGIRGQRVLSIGCGPTLFGDVAHFGEVPKELVGLDINENNLRFLRSSQNAELRIQRSFLREHGVGVNLVEADALRSISKFRGQFDSIYAMGVLGMFGDRDLATLLFNVWQYLKPSGKLVDVDWTDCRLSAVKLEERRRYSWYSPGAQTFESVGKHIRAAGFSIRRQSKYAVSSPENYQWGEIYGYDCTKS